jgi:hypothetical protein
MVVIHGIRREFTIHNVDRPARSKDRVVSVHDPLLRSARLGQADPWVRNQRRFMRSDIRRLSFALIAQQLGLIPSLTDDYPWAHFRSPMDMMVQG